MHLIGTCINAPQKPATLHISAFRNEIARRGRLSQTIISPSGRFVHIYAAHPLAASARLGALDEAMSDWLGVGA